MKFDNHCILATSTLPDYMNELMNHPIGWFINKLMLLL